MIHVLRSNTAEAHIPSQMAPNIFALHETDTSTEAESQSAHTAAVLQ